MDSCRHISVELGAKQQNLQSIVLVALLYPSPIRYSYDGGKSHCRQGIYCPWGAQEQQVYRQEQSWSQMKANVSHRGNG